MGSNMKLSTVSAHNLHKFNKQNEQKHGKGPTSVFSSHVSRGSRVKSALHSRKSIPSRSAIIDSHKKRIIEAVNNLNEEELEKVSEMLKVAESLDAQEKKAEDEADVVTAPDDGDEEKVQEDEGEEQGDNCLDDIEVQTPHIAGPD